MTTPSPASCILVIGSTGTGKSSLVSLCTGAEVDTSAGTQECTIDIQVSHEVVIRELLYSEVFTDMSLYSEQHVVI